jgi:hypothetical protein
MLSNDDMLVTCNIHDGTDNLVLSINKKAAATIAALPPAFQAAFSRLPTVRMPRRDEEVHNDECLFSFDNPESEHGIFLPVVPSITRGTATFYAYGAGHCHRPPCFLTNFWSQVPATSMIITPEQAVRCT